MKNKKRKNSTLSRILSILIIILLIISAVLIYKYTDNNNQQWANANVALTKVDDILKKEVDFRVKQPDIGTVIGKIKVNSVTDWMPLIEGEDLDKAMMHGVGHIESTPMPGSEGNSVVSAHRETFFKALENVSIGDMVTVEMPYGTFEYEIVDDIIVMPNEGNKIYGYEFKNGEGITLLTCYPFNPLSSPDERIAFFAQLVK